MNSELIPRQGQGLASPGGRPSRAVQRAVRNEREKAVVAAARVNRVAVTSQVALMRAGELSELEAQLTRMSPLGEARYKAIADAATLGFTNIIFQQTMD